MKPFFVTRNKDHNGQGDIYPASWGEGSLQNPVQEQIDEYEYISPNGSGYPVYSSCAKTDGNPKKALIHGTEAKSSKAEESGVVGSQRRKGGKVGWKKENSGLRSRCHGAESKHRYMTSSRLSSTAGRPRALKLTLDMFPPFPPPSFYSLILLI